MKFLSTNLSKRNSLSRIHSRTSSKYQAHGGCWNFPLVLNTKTVVGINWGALTTSLLHRPHHQGSDRAPSTGISWEKNVLKSECFWINIFVHIVLNGWRKGCDRKVHLKDAHLFEEIFSLHSSDWWATLWGGCCLTIALRNIVHNQELSWQWRQAEHFFKWHNLNLPV